MEKLLHERLKEWTSDECTAPVYVIALKDACGAAANDAFTALADEIERYYIPRPRFEDGEPVQFGGEVEGCNGGLKALLLFNDGSGQAYGSKDDPWEPMGGIDFAHDDLKRPTPKVYDADGVEIKVGQEVYDIDKEGNRYIVLIPYDDSIDANFTVKCRDLNMGGIEFHCLPSQLTHEKPVFDAEGVRICKGDTVWTKNGGSGKVVSIHYKGETPVRGLSPANSPFIRYEGGCWNYANEVTHREPDSIQRVRDYARKLADDGAYNEDELNEIADRLTALIERDAK